MMQATKETILKYLPHRPPFVMIDEVTVADDGGSARSSFFIEPQNVLVENGVFTAAGLVENMAQTAGAAVGLKSGASVDGPQLGYIGAVKDLKIIHLPQTGQTLHTEVIFAHQIMHALIIRGAVYAGGTLVAGCELKIFLQAGVV